MYDKGKGLKVLYLSAEVSPFFKVGGLADVAGSLPKALSSLGIDIRIVTPLHSLVKEAKDTGYRISVPAYQGYQALLLENHLPGSRVPVYLLFEPRLLCRGKVYGYEDDLDRFAFFSLTALKVPEAIGFKPDLIHANEWHTALAIYFLGKQSPKIATLFSIHNLNYQGPFSEEWFSSRFGKLDETTFRRYEISPSMMALALLSADFINAVSPTYAREILTPEYGCGLDKLLQTRKERLFGILNGIDYEVYDPAKDPFLPFKFDLRNVEVRSGNKVRLQRQLGLPEKDVPLFGKISRLVEQKGIDILLQALAMAFSAGKEFQLVLLGEGEENYERQVLSLSERYPDKFKVVFSFDEPLAHLIYGGSDYFLMPSRFEPCGLGQMIAMRYGSIPIVRSTGGLADTVEDLTRDLSSGTGIVFKEHQAEALLSAIDRALDIYSQPSRWQVIWRAMRQDFSWQASAQEYIKLYEKAIWELKP